MSCKWNKVPLQKPNLVFFAFAHEVVTETNPLKEEFDDEETWGEIKETGTESSSEDDTDDAMSDIHPLITSTPPYKLTATTVATERITGDVMASSPPTSSLVTKLFPQLKPKPKQVQVQVRHIEDAKRVHGEKNAVL